MDDFQQIDAWISQATADLNAGKTKASEIMENHRRYWFQQAYEKAIYDEIQQTQPQSSAMRKLQREIHLFLNGFDDAKLLKQIDATRPFFDPKKVSYRYPFLQDDKYIAPSNYTEWEAYQGNELRVTSAIDRLIRTVRDEAKRQRRGPR